MWYFILLRSGKRETKKEGERVDTVVVVKRIEREITDVGHLEVTIACAVRLYLYSPSVELFSAHNGRGPSGCREKHNIAERRGKEWKERIWKD